MSKLELSQQEFDLLRGFVERECGISVGDEKSYLIETRLASMVVQAGCESFQAFYDKLVGDPKSSLRDKVVDAMTTNETLWFRDDGPWSVLRQKLLPGWCEDLGSGRRKKVRIWSAAASTGQEAYSMAITILDYLRENQCPGVKEESFEIFGTDISPSALFVAISGRYDALSVSRGLDEEFRDRYFEQNGRIWTLSDRVKQRVEFKKFNLMHSFAPFGSFDLVLCRNVLIYFSQALKQEIIKKIAGQLTPSSHLIVGASESLQGISSDFTLRECERHHYYQLSGGASR